MGEPLPSPQMGNTLLQHWNDWPPKSAKKGTPKGAKRRMR